MNTKRIREQYLQVLPKLQEVLSLVREKLVNLPQSHFEIETNLKPFKSVERKVGTDHLHKVADMSDLVRGRVFFSNKHTMEKVVRLLKNLLKEWSPKVDVKKDKGNGLQYFGITHIDLNINGINFELQIMPLEYKPFKPFLHKIYEKLRESNNNLSTEQKDKLISTHNKLYKAIHNRAQSNRRLN